MAQSPAEAFRAALERHRAAQETARALAKELADRRAAERDQQAQQGGQS